MLDNFGYRLGVGMVVCRDDGKLLWCKRKELDAWQFPQGGIEEGETPKAAMWRELQEEIGLSPHHAELLQTTEQWLYYEFPEHLKISYRGQKQIWFFLKLLVGDEHINLAAADEFECWRWVDWKHPPAHIVAFKKAIYQRALACFASVK